MALNSETIKKCAVKIVTYVSGVPVTGSGIVYETPNYCSYNYILTAKHLFQEDSITPILLDHLISIDVFYSLDGKLKKLQHIKKTEIKDRLIVFEDDIAIVIIDKNEFINFHPIIVTDKLGDNDLNYFSWGVFTANDHELALFNFERNDPENKRIKLLNPPSFEVLSGLSGGGVFIKNSYTLYGIISRYPNDNFENDTIDCTLVSFESINSILKALNKIQLDTQSSKHKREIKNIVVDIHQVVINDVILDLELSRRRLQTDIIDDWFHDPLKYIDLLNQDYLFKQFEEFFLGNKYKADIAEQFYVPKKKLGLRQALVLPFIDRIMYMAVVGVLAEKMDNAMIPTVYSARYDKHSKKQLVLNGVEQWKKMKYILAQKIHTKNEDNWYKYECIVEIDLLNFYDNINKKLLIDKIRRVCETENERKACELLSEILDNISEKAGIPQNNDASSLLASFYLNQVDNYMQNCTFGYFRFMDDIKILCKDKYEGRKILQQFEFELRRCDLSINAQKTKIRTIVDQEIEEKDNEVFRGSYTPLFDFQLNKISRLRKSENYAYLNQAFHESIDMLIENIQGDIDESDDAGKKLNYALNTIESLGKINITLYNNNSRFTQTLLTVTESLIDKPWLTTQVCKVLSLLSKDTFKITFANKLKQIILDDRLNTYSFQVYQIWLLIAKHKYKSEELISFAVKNIEKNDETNRAVIAAMIIYVCSVDEDYKRVVLRKFGQGFTNKYFQNRVVLIALRSFSSELIPTKYITQSLSAAPEFTNAFKDKDLVYIHGSEQDNDELDETNFEQLYSL